MTTQSWSTVVDHSGDAGFRAWVAEFIAKAIAAGLVQTADTGQINTVTVTRPGTNTEGGYSIFRMNDTQQATAPVFFRIGYGTAGGATTPRIQITVGTGSNGTGTITGTALTTARTAGGGTPLSTVTAYQSLLCVTEGFFGFSWKIGGAVANVAMASFVINRSCDSSGVPTAIGAFVIWGLGNATSLTGCQNLRFAATASAGTFKSAATDLPFVIPASPTSSLTAAGNNQVWLWWMAIPDVLPMIGIGQIVRSEVSVTTTFTATLIGSTPHTYIGMGQAFPGDVASNTVYGPAMLWE